MSNFTKATFLYFSYCSGLALSRTSFTSVFFYRPFLFSWFLAGKSMNNDARYKVTQQLNHKRISVCSFTMELLKV